MQNDTRSHWNVIAAVIGAWLLLGLAHYVGLVPGVSAQDPQQPEITLAAVGDIMLARDMGRALLAYGPEYPFQQVRQWLAQADVAMGNLECPISERGEPERKGYTFRAPPSAVDALRDGGFDVLNLANNHALDYGLLAFQDTLDLLAQGGMRAIGAGLNEASAYAPLLLTVKGLRLAFLAYAHYPTEGASGYQGQSSVALGDRPGIAWANLDRIRREVAAARTQADLVIVALHAGWEYAESPNDFQRQAARAAIDAGACLVWGHHPHVLQGIESYRDGVILYSLGDFVFDQMPDNDTVIARVRLDRRGVRQVELLPVSIVENGRPAPAEPLQGQRILKRIETLNAALR